jgi:asparagine synthase (glutamine-hydrolysing)
MCGIAGAFAFKEEGKSYLNRLNQAMDSIKHRGPDGDGIFKDDRVALGHKRLAIIDTSVAANQPQYSDDKRYCILFNGEIFNYKELAAKYFPQHHFKTTSDTEVFLELFIKIGPNCFKELRGFFAVAIYDSLEQVLYMVRDRFGKKPMLVYRDENALAFASELKGLIAFGIPRKINWEVLPYYFQLNYIPQPLSILQNVQKLLPGHYLKVTAEGVEDNCYYELKVRSDDYKNLTYGCAKQKLFDLLDEATKFRLIADVPLGAFLSGGIDSSVVVSLAARHKQKLKTFSIGYKDHPFFDETDYANLVAKKFNTDHTVFSLTNNDFLEHIDEVLNSIDEPFADSSAIPTYILSKQTRKHVTVALTGDGGDEVFAGYNKYKAEWNMMQPSIQKTFVKGLGPLWKVLPKSRNDRFSNKIRQLNRFAEAVGLTATDRYWRWASMMPEKNSYALFNNSFSQNFNKKKLSDIFNWRISGKDINEVLLADTKLVLLSDMLVKVDLMSMANSLEIRSPFLDAEVVEFAFGLPSNYKIDGNMKKKIVQDAFKDILPKELYNRPKRGFEIPMLGWLRKELWGLIDKDLLEDDFIKEQAIFNVDVIKTLKKKLQSNDPGDSHATIWALVVFQFWWKKYIYAV